MSTRILHLLLAAWLLAGSNVFAACTTSPIFLPFHYRVGADTQHCQYDDIQTAIDAVGECPTVIDITREHLYTHQHLGIADKPNLTLQGWGDGVTCAMIRGPLDFPPYAPPDSTAPLLTINGSADGGGSVLYVTGNTNLALRNLTISGGLTCADCSGGGISFGGQGSLALTRSTISFNEAAYGAGINVNGSGGAAALTLDSDTLVLSNTADISGGGVRVEGNARLYALKPNTMIAFNKAPNGYGGGLEVLGPGRADIGSPGYGGLGVIYDNQAQYGGGIDVLTFDDGADAIVRVFSTDSTRPVRIQGNAATHTGGAVYLKPRHSFVGNGTDVAFCAYDFRIDDNIAVEGAAIYSDADYDVGGLALGGHVALNTDPNPGHLCTQTEPPTALGAVVCAAGTACNRIEGNHAEDGTGQPTDGSTILLQDASNLSGERVEFRANAGAHVLRQTGHVGDQFAYFASCLFDGNTVTQELIAQTDADDSTVLTLDSCTVAGNTIGAPYAFLAPGRFELFNSIIDQPGRATVDPAITDPGHAAHVLTNDRSTLPDTAYMHQGEPSFVDSAHGDYHLLPTSLGIDNAPIDQLYFAPHADLDRRSRVVDLPNVPNQFGPMDLGAYEIQPACSSTDTIFCNGFE